MFTLLNAPHNRGDFLFPRPIGQFIMFTAARARRLLAGVFPLTCERFSFQCAHDE